MTFWSIQIWRCVRRAWLRLIGNGSALQDEVDNADQRIQGTIEFGRLDDLVFGLGQAFIEKTVKHGFERKCCRGRIEVLAKANRLLHPDHLLEIVDRAIAQPAIGHLEFVTDCRGLGKRKKRGIVRAIGLPDPADALLPFGRCGHYPAIFAMFQRQMAK